VLFDFFCVRRIFEEDKRHDVGSPSRADALRSRFVRASFARVEPRGAKEKRKENSFPLFF
jgi:hypothetical protein